MVVAIPNMINDKKVGYVMGTGMLFFNDEVSSSDIGVSPALNVNQASVIFSSETSSGIYKLTVKDSTISVNVSNVSRDGSKITVSNSLTGSADRISVVMTDGTWSDSTGWSTTVAPKYYGTLDNSGSFTLPNGYQSDWNTYIIAEKINAGNATDYASTLPAYWMTRRRIS